MKKAIVLAFLILCVGCNRPPGQSSVAPQPGGPAALQAIGALDQAMPSSAAFSHDAKLVLVGYATGGSPIWPLEQHRLKLFETETGRRLWAVQATRDLYPVGLLPEGKTAVVRSDQDHSEVWDLQERKPIRTFGHVPNGYISEAAALSADGKLLLAGELGDPKLKLWDVSTGILVRSFEGFIAGIHDIALTPDGRFAVTCHNLNEQGFPPVNVWDVETGQVLESSPRTKWGRTLAFSPDSKLGVCLEADSSASSTGRLAIREVPTGKEIGTSKDWGWKVAFVPDGKLVVIGDVDSRVATLKMVDWQHGAIVWAQPIAENIAAFAISPNGTRGLTVSAPHVIDGGGRLGQYCGT
jgi:WD40 repeat protein